MGALSVRRVELADALHIAEIEKICFSDPWSLDGIKSRLMSELSLLLLCERDGAVCGYVDVSHIPPECEIYRVAVLPEYRRQGIAAALLSAVFDKIKREENTFFLEVRESNSAARGLYASFGFSEIAVRKNYYSCPRENAIILSLGGDKC